MGVDWLMAHFAKIDEQNLVTAIIVISNEDMTDGDGNEVEALGRAVCETVAGPGRWVQTSYNNNFRKQYAQVGFTYDGDADVFISLSPFPSWVLNDQYDWEAPTPMPTDGGFYEWDETTLTWNEIPMPTEEPTP